MNGAQKKQRLRLDAEERELARAVKEFYREHANWLRPRSKTASRSEAELLALGGRKDVILLGESRRQTRIIFGGVGETRLIFTPQRGGWIIAREDNPSLEELKSKLNKSRSNLWNAAQKKRDIAVQAVDALLSCSRDWQDFTALPKSEQEKADFYRAIVRVQLAISTTLQALKRDDKNKSRKLQVAFKLLSDDQHPTQIQKLRAHVLLMALDLQRPPSKKELKDSVDPPLPHHPLGLVSPSGFSKRLKAAGLSWLKRSKREIGVW